MPDILTPDVPPLIYYYLTEFSDETMPCPPALANWADWLSAPDPQWGRDEAAKDGDEFEATTITMLEDIEASPEEDGKWRYSPPPSPLATFFAVGNSRSWEGEQAGGSPEEALDMLHDEGDPVSLAQGIDGPTIRVRYNLTLDGPRLTVLGPVQ